MDSLQQYLNKTKNMDKNTTNLLNQPLHLTKYYKNVDMAAKMSKIILKLALNQ